MKLTLFRRWLGAGLLFALAACQRQPAPLPDVSPEPTPTILQIGIASSAAPLAESLTDAYEPADGQTAVQFIPGNTQTLLADLEGGELDAILIHRLPEGLSNWTNPVALDGVVLVVHPENPVAGMTLAEAQAVFSGRLQNWSTVGGEDQPIIVISRESGSSVRALFAERVMAEQRFDINALIQTGNEALLTAVAAEPNAIGLSMMGAAEGVKTLALDGVAATPSSTGTQTYPLTTPLYFVNQSAQEPQGALRAWLAWLQSPAGQQVVGQRYGRIR